MSALFSFDAIQEYLRKDGLSAKMHRAIRNAVIHIEGAGSPQKKVEHIQPARTSLRAPACAHQPARCMLTVCLGGDSSC